MADRIRNNGSVFHSNYSKKYIFRKTNFRDSASVRPLVFEKHFDTEKEARKFRRFFTDLKKEKKLELYNKTKTPRQVGWRESE